MVSDNLLAMRLTVDHLVELGHRRIGHIAGPASLLAKIEKPASDAVTVKLTPQLIVRGSTAAPRSHA